MEGAVWASRLHAQTEVEADGLVNIIPIIGVLHSYLVASDKDGMYKIAAIWLFVNFMRNSKAVALAAGFLRKAKFSQNCVQNVN